MSAISPSLLPPLPLSHSLFYDFFPTLLLQWRFTLMLLCLLLKDDSTNAHAFILLSPYAHLEFPLSPILAQTQIHVD